MSYAAFTFNAESASNADKEGGRIQKTGKYIGKIKFIEFFTAKSGSQGLEIFFKSDSNEETSLQVYTHKADGTPIDFQCNKINAMMACLKTKSLTPEVVTIDKYDFDLKKEVPKQTTIAKEVKDKDIGFLLQAEEYLNSNHEVKTKMTLFSSFEASTGFMAKEILERKTTPEALEKKYARLMQIGDKKLTESQSSGGGYGGVPQVIDQDDDLPF